LLKSRTRQIGGESSIYVIVLSPDTQDALHFDADRDELLGRKLLHFQPAYEPKGLGIPR